MRALADIVATKLGFMSPYNRAEPLLQVFEPVKLYFGETQICTEKNSQWGDE